MKVNPKRYRTRDVRKFASGEFQEFAMANSEPLAVGLSESLLYSFASKMKRSTRQGRKFAFGEFQKFPLCGNLQWTLGEIAEVLESKRVRRRKRPVSLQMVEEIRAGLICLGFRFEDRKFPLRGNSRSSPAANLRRSSRS